MTMPRRRRRRCRAGAVAAPPQLPLTEPVRGAGPRGGAVAARMRLMERKLGDEEVALGAEDDPS